MLCASALFVRRSGEVVAVGWFYQIFWSPVWQGGFIGFY
jgi:hypothetical protein